MKKHLSIIGLIWLSIAMLSSCQIFKKTDSTEETSLEEISKEEMTTEVILDEVSEEIIEEKPEEHPILVTYERTYCFGMCPVFKSEVLKDGTVLYEGINFVDNMGKHTAVAPESDLDSIKSMLKSVNYFELDSTYDNPAVMDIPAVLSSADLNGESHSVYDRWKAPKELKELYKLLDEIYARLEWQAVTKNE